MNAVQPANGVPYNEEASRDRATNTVEWWETCAKKYGYTAIALPNGIYFKAPAGTSLLDHLLDRELGLVFGVIPSSTRALK